MTTPGNGGNGFGAPVERPPLIEVDPAPSGAPSGAPSSTGGPPVLRASAGSSTRAHLVLTNSADAPRILQISTHGLDASWLPPISRSRVLQPGESIAVELTLRPALGTVPAVYPLAITVQALDPVTESATAQVALADLQLTVDAPGRLAVRLSPAEIAGARRRKVEVEVENTGSQHASVHLEAEGSSGLRIQLDEPVVEVPAGQIRQVRARVGAKRKRLLGSRIRHTYTVTGRAKGAPHVAEGAFTSRAFLGKSTGLVAVVVALLAIWVGGVVIFIPKLANHVKNSHVASSSTQSTTKTATPSGGGPSSGPGGGSGGGTSGSGSGPNSPTKPSGSAGSPGGNNPTTVSATNSVQLNGTVGGSAPGGVLVTVAPINPVQAVTSAETGTTPAGESVTPLGYSADAVTGKISSDTIGAALPFTVSQHKTTVTSKDGAWAIPGVAKPGYYLVTFTKPGFQTSRFIVDSSSAVASQPMAVALVSGQGSLTGTISGPTGAVGGAGVTITDGTNTLSTSSTSTAGSAGHWSVTGLSTPDSYLVTVSANGLATQSTLVTLGPGASSSVALTLPSGVSSLMGKVIGRDNSGNVAGLGAATVTASSSSVTRTASTVTKAGVIGNYILPALPPGDYTVTVSASGFVTQTSKITISNGEPSKTQNATLTSATASVYGTAVDQGGAGQVGAGVVLANATNTYKTTTTSSPAGGFTFDGVAAGTYTMTTTMFGFATSTQTVTVAPGDMKPEPVSLQTASSTVSATAHLVGNVVDARTGAPVICPNGTDGKPTNCLMASITNPNYDAHGGTSDPCNKKTFSFSFSSASYALPNPTTDPGCGLPPGLYTVDVSAADYEPASVNASVALGAQSTAPVATLNPAPVITGVITSAADTSPTQPSCIWAVAQGASTPSAFGCGLNSGPTPGCPAQSAWPAGSTCDSLLSGVGAYSMVVPLHGTYEVYVQSADPEFVTAGSVAVAGASINAPLASTVQYSATLNRWGRMTLTVEEPTASGVLSPTLNPVSVTVLQGGTSCATGTTPAGWPPAGIPSTYATQSNGDGTVTVQGLNGTYWFCATDSATGNSGGVQLFAGISHTATAVLPLSQTVPSVIGRVVYQVGSSSPGVPNAPVKVLGISKYSGANAVMTGWDVNADSQGCFIIQSVGAAAPSNWGECAGSPLQTNYATYVAAAGTNTYNAAGFAQRQNASLQSNTVSVGIGGLNGFNDYSANNLTMPLGSTDLTLSPKPVQFSGAGNNTLQAADNFGGGASDPVWSSVNLSVTPQPGTTGTFTLVTGSVGTHQVALGTSPSNASIPVGQYTVTGTLSGYQQASATLTCFAVAPTGSGATGPGCLFGTVDSSNHWTASSLVLQRQASLQITVADGSSNPVSNAIVTLTDNGAAVQSGTAAAGSISFTGVPPNDSNLGLLIQAPGFTFSTATANHYVLTCGASSTIPALSAGTSQACTATLTALATLAGTVQGKDVQPTSCTGSSCTYSVSGSPAASLPSATVTATQCVATPTHDPTTNLDYCAPATTSSNQTIQFTTTSSTFDGSYSITGTNQMEGLDPGNWIVSVVASGYCNAKPTSATPTACPANPTVPAGDVIGQLKQISGSGQQNFSPVVYHLPAVLTIKATIGTSSTAASGVTFTLSGNGLSTPLTPTESPTGTYTFPALAPGTYSLAYSGYGWVTGTAQVPVSAGQSAPTIAVAPVVNTVSGTVRLANGAASPPAASGATVCVVTSPTAPCDGTAVATATVASDGTYQFLSLANSPRTCTDPSNPATCSYSSYYVEAGQYGYVTTYSPGFLMAGSGSSINQPLSLPLVKRTVVITVTGPTSDPLNGSWDATSGTNGALTSTTPATAPASVTLPDSSLTTPALSGYSWVTGGSNNVKQLTITQVPFGCWSFSYALAGHVPGHYGTATYTGTGTDSTLTCTGNSLLVGGDATTNIAINVTLNESPLTATVTNSSPLTPALQVPTVNVTATDASSATTFYNNTLAVGGPTTLAWVDPTTQANYSMSLTGNSAPTWSVTPSCSAVTSCAIALTPKKGTVQVTLQNSVTSSSPSDLNGATVSLINPPTGYYASSTTLSSSSHSGAVYTFTNVPVGVWGISVTGLTDYPDSTSGTVTATNGSTASQTVSLTPSQDTVTVTLSNAYGTTSTFPSLSGITVTLQSSVGYANLTATTNGSGQAKFNNNVYDGGGWTAQAGGASTNWASNATTAFVVSGMTAQSLSLTPGTTSVAVTVNTHAGPPVTAGVTVSLTGPTDYPSHTTALTATTNASGVATFTGVPYGSGYTASVTGTYSGSSPVTVDTSATPITATVNSTTG